MHKQDFPLLQRKVNGKPIVYLDNAATTQKPEVVLQAMDAYYRKYNANVHRGIYSISEEATIAYEEVRQKVAKFINAKKEEIIFTKSATEGFNLLAYTLTQELEEGDEILLTEMEHHSNLVPWQQRAMKQKFVLKFIPVTAEGELDLTTLDQLLTEKTKIVSLVHISNVLGTLNPIKEIIQRAKKVGARTVIDGAQSIAHKKIDVREIGCDFFVFSGHKMYGPTGVGVVYGKMHLLEKMPPFLYGGDMIKTVELQASTWNDIPWKFEAGTPNISEVIGLGAAINYLTEIGMTSIQEYEEKLSRYALQKVTNTAGTKVYGTGEGTVISFTLADVPAHDVATLVDREGVCVRAGTHCAMPLLSKLGIHGTVRASFAFYNTKEDVDALIGSIKKAQEVFA
jgi:cysteine desulfurase / selenocysteine lyase